MVYRGFQWLIALIDSPPSGGECVQHYRAVQDVTIATKDTLTRNKRLRANILTTGSPRPRVLRNPRWTTRALWYPPAQSRRHLPNAGSAVGERDAPGTASKGMLAVNWPGWASLTECARSGPRALSCPRAIPQSGGKGTVPKTAPHRSVQCSAPIRRPASPKAP